MANYEFRIDENGFLSAGAILEQPTLVIEELVVPEWGGGKIRLKHLSAKERDEFESSMVKVTRGGRQQMNPDNFPARLVQLAALNEEAQVGQRPRGDLAPCWLPGRDRPGDPARADADPHSGRVLRAARVRLPALAPDGNGWQVPLRQPQPRRVRRARVELALRHGRERRRDARAGAPGWPCAVPS